MKRINFIFFRNMSYLNINLNLTLKQINKEKNNNLVSKLYNNIRINYNNKEILIIYHNISTNHYKIKNHYEINNAQITQFKETSKHH